MPKNDALRGIAVLMLGALGGGGTFGFLKYLGVPVAWAIIAALLVGALIIKGLEDNDTYE